MITLGITFTPSQAKFWTPGITFAGKYYYPDQNLMLGETYSPPGGWSGTLDVRVIIYDANQNIIDKRDTTVRVTDGKTYFYFWDQAKWVEESPPVPPPPPPPPPEEFYIWADIQPASAGQVSGVTWSLESGALKAGPFRYGQTVTLTAIPTEGYRFISWEVNDEYAGAQASLPLMIITELYIRVRFSEVVVPPPEEEVWMELARQVVYMQTITYPPEDVWVELVRQVIYLKTVEYPAEDVWVELIVQKFYLEAEPLEPPIPPEPPEPPEEKFPWGVAAAVGGGLLLLTAGRPKKGEKK